VFVYLDRLMICLHKVVDGEAKANTATTVTATPITAATATAGLPPGYKLPLFFV
jgi:hypothetical protein